MSGIRKYLNVSLGTSRRSGAGTSVDDREGPASPLPFPAVPRVTISDVHENSPGLPTTPTYADEPPPSSPRRAKVLSWLPKPAVKLATSFSVSTSPTTAPTANARPRAETVSMPSTPDRAGTGDPVTTASTLAVPPQASPTNASRRGSLADTIRSSLQLSPGTVPRRPQPRKSDLDIAEQHRNLFPPSTAPEAASVHSHDRFLTSVEALEYAIATKSSRASFQPPTASAAPSPDLSSTPGKSLSIRIPSLPASNPYDSYPTVATSQPYLNADDRRRLSFAQLLGEHPPSPELDTVYPCSASIRSFDSAVSATTDPPGKPGRRPGSGHGSPTSTHGVPGSAAAAPSPLGRCSYSASHASLPPTAPPTTTDRQTMVPDAERQDPCHESPALPSPESYGGTWSPSPRPVPALPLESRPDHPPLRSRQSQGAVIDDSLRRTSHTPDHHNDDDDGGSGRGRHSATHPGLRPRLPLRLDERYRNLFSDTSRYRARRMTVHLNRLFEKPLAYMRGTGSPTTSTSPPPAGASPPGPPADQRGVSTDSGSSFVVHSVVRTTPRTFNDTYGRNTDPIQHLFTYRPSAEFGIPGPPDSSSPAAGGETSAFHTLLFGTTSPHDRKVSLDQVTPNRYGPPPRSTGSSQSLGPAMGRAQTTDIRALPRAHSSDTERGGSLPQSATDGTPSCRQGGPSPAWSAAESPAVTMRYRGMSIDRETPTLPPRVRIPVRTTSLHSCNSDLDSVASVSTHSAATGVQQAESTSGGGNHAHQYPQQHYHGGTVHPPSTLANQVSSFSQSASQSTPSAPRVTSSEATRFSTGSHPDEHSPVYPQPSHQNPHPHHHAPLSLPPVLSTLSALSAASDPDDTALLAAPIPKPFAQNDLVVETAPSSASSRSSVSSTSPVDQTTGFIRRPSLGSPPSSAAPWRPNLSPTAPPSSPPPLTVMGMANHLPSSPPPPLAQATSRPPPHRMVRRPSSPLARSPSPNSTRPHNALRIDTGRVRAVPVPMQGVAEDDDPAARATGPPKPLPRRPDCDHGMPSVLSLDLSPSQEPSPVASVLPLLDPVSAFSPTGQDYLGAISVALQSTQDDGIVVPHGPGPADSGAVVVPMNTRDKTVADHPRPASASELLARVPVGQVFTQPCSSNASLASPRPIENTLPSRIPRIPPLTSSPVEHRFSSEVYESLERSGDPGWDRSNFTPYPAGSPASASPPHASSSSPPPPPPPPHTASRRPTAPRPTGCDADGPTTPSVVGLATAASPTDSDFNPDDLEPTDDAGDMYLQEALAAHDRGDMTLATAQFRRAAEEGSALGLFFYGLARRHGWGCRADPDFAFRCLQKAVSHAIRELKDGIRSTAATRVAQRELTIALYELAVCYQNGWGVAISLPTAAFYFEIAADLGDPDAQNDIAFCYLNGLGVPLDKFRAAHYFRLASRQGVGIVGNSWIFKSKYANASSP
ncbi:hypothetical protein IWQ60_000416 [Tieghemiomyces parasiticus]|uniref:Uncharacterized protein n=1 Tax=Tieghemiomyces parasiticus TaxID=78921 RepID=A0A9W8AMA1_9FUNG|nr:hypothetical protein IWQ60_000416 [Tieghemiomyces parasiticus]